MFKVRKPKNKPQPVRGHSLHFPPKPTPKFTEVGLFLDDERHPKHVGFCSDQPQVNWKVVRTLEEAKAYVEDCISKEILLNSISLDIYLGSHRGGEIEGITFFRWFDERMREQKANNAFMIVNDDTMINVHSQSEHAPALRRLVAIFEKWLWGWDDK